MVLIVNARLPGVSIDTCDNEVVGLNMVEGQVNGCTATVLHDTGSPSVCVHSRLLQKDKNIGRVRKIVLARECCDVWVTIVTPYISSTVLDLKLVNCVTVSTQPQVIGSKVS